MGPYSKFSICQSRVRNDNDTTIPTISDDSNIVDNKIYFYSDINSDQILKLNQQIKYLENKFLSEQLCRNLPEPVPIYLYVNSDGGFIFDALSAMDEIINCKVPIYTVVDGISASAATYLTIVGKKRFIKKHSFMMIHQPSSEFWGKLDNIREHTQNMELIFSVTNSVYQKHTKISHDELLELLKHDLWWSSEKCLEYGLVDEII